MNLILFVDDDPKILAGLQRLLFDQSDEWETVFAEGGAAALEELAEDDFDLVISDMRMPNMDGAELLKQVSCKHPEVVRVILSGQMNRSMALRGMPHCHQYLSKPCEKSVLVSTITRILNLRGSLPSEIRRLIGGSTTVPVREAVLDRARTALEDGDVDALVSTFEGDAMLSGRLLQFMRNPFFGDSEPTLNVREALEHFGLDGLRQMPLNEVFVGVADSTMGGLDLTSWNRRALLVARLTQEIVGGRRTDALVAGLHHGLGALILAQHGASCAVEVSQEIIGAYLTGLWGGSPALVAAVAKHAGNAAVSSGEDGNLTNALGAAALLAEEQEQGRRMDGVDCHLSDGGFNSNVSDLRALARETLAEMVNG